MTKDTSLMATLLLSVPKKAKRLNSFAKEPGFKKIFLFRRFCYLPSPIQNRLLGVIHLHTQNYNAPYDKWLSNHVVKLGIWVTYKDFLGQLRFLLNISFLEIRCALKSNALMFHYND